MKNFPKPQWQIITQWICFVALMQTLLFCKRESTDPQPVIPNPVNSGIVFKNTQVSNLTDTGADISTDLELSNGKQFSGHGHCWSDTRITPTIDDNRTRLGAISTSNTLKSQMTGLTKGTRYYARSYGVTDNGVVYGDVTSFTTTNSPTPTNPPTVETAPTTDVTTNSLTAKGKITANGSSDVTEYGICWVTGDAIPTISDTKVVATNRDGAGAFSASISSLTASTTYSLRAYATNASGTSYGTVEKVKTADAPVANAPGVETSEVGGATANSLNAKGKITNNGSSNVTEYGFVYAEGDVVPALGSANKQTASNRDGSGNFTATISGLGAGKVFSVRAYATNSTGTTYGGKLTGTTTSVVTNAPPSVETNEVNGATANTLNAKGKITNNGSSDVTEYGFVYAEGDVVPVLGSANKQTATNRDGSGNFTATLTGLGSGKTFSVRAYATNRTGTAYGAKMTGTTTSAPSIPPTVTTGDIAGITQTTARVSGKITNNGSSNVTEYGVCWVTGDATPTISNNKTAGGSLTNGDFTSNLTGLTYALYSVRAYATNSAGTSYGVKKTFTTTATPPVEITEVKNISYTTATVSTRINYNPYQNQINMGYVSTQGICWVQGTGTPTTADTRAVGGSVTNGVYSTNLIGLRSGTNHTVRAYVIYSFPPSADPFNPTTPSPITVYSDTKFFRTDFEVGLPESKPTVETISADVRTVLVLTTVTLKGKITSNGSTNVTAYGFCWISGNRTPTINDSKIAGGSLSSGEFSATIAAGLTVGTTYTVRAYATNSNGTSYGSEKTFTR